MCRGLRPHPPPLTLETIHPDPGLDRPLETNLVGLVSVGLTPLPRLFEKEVDGKLRVKGKEREHTLSPKPSSHANPVVDSRIQTSPTKSTQDHVLESGTGSSLWTLEVGRYPPSGPDLPYGVWDRSPVLMYPAPEDPSQWII